MSKPVGLTHILTELSSLDDLSALLKRSARLKYTCISACKKYLALGSNNGAVYVFNRDTLKYQQVVFADSNSSRVTGICLSPTSQHVATAVSNGHVNVFELNIECRAKPERVRHTFDHAGHSITVMTWDTSGQKLFIGDDAGKLSVVFVPNKKSKALFAMPSEVIAYLDISIFQMDWWDNKLLVSTLTNCYLFDTNRHNYSSIGSKKRDGEFGACIFLEPASLCPVIYCARPGSRIWEVDFEGEVLNTHQFKQLLAVPPVPVLNILTDSYSPSETEIQGGQSISFSKMIPLGSLLLTWSNKGLYLFDPINVKVIVWTDSFRGIQDIALYGNDAYLFLNDSSIHRLTLLSIYPLFQLLASRARWSLMSCLLLSSDQINMHASIVKRVRKDLFELLVNGLKENGNTEMVERLHGMMDDVSESSVNSASLGDDFMGATTTINDDGLVMGHTTLPSGMVIISEGFSMDPPTTKLTTSAKRDYGSEFNVMKDGDGGGIMLSTSVGVDLSREEWDGGLEKIEEQLEGKGGEHDMVENDDSSFGGGGVRESVGSVRDNESGIERKGGEAEEDGTGNGHVCGTMRNQEKLFYDESLQSVSVEEVDKKEVGFSGKDEISLSRADEFEMHSAENDNEVGSHMGIPNNEICDDFLQKNHNQHSEERSLEEDALLHGNENGRMNQVIIKNGNSNSGEKIADAEFVVHRQSMEIGDDDSEVKEDCIDKSSSNLESSKGSCSFVDISGDREPTGFDCSQVLRQHADVQTGVGHNGDTIGIEDSSPFDNSSKSNVAMPGVTNDVPRKNSENSFLVTSSSSSSAGLENKRSDIPVEIAQPVDSENNNGDVNDILLAQSKVVEIQNHSSTESHTFATTNNSNRVCEQSEDKKPTISLPMDNFVKNNNSNPEPKVAPSVTKQQEQVMSLPSVSAPKESSASGNNSTANTDSPRRFSNVHIRKEDSDVIAKAVRKPKKKKKQKAHTMDQSDRNLSGVQPHNILRSSSCSDLLQPPSPYYLHQHSKEQDPDSISISTISSIGEDDVVAEVEEGEEEEVTQHHHQLNNDNIDDERATFALSSSSFGEEVGGGGGREDESPKFRDRRTVVRKHSYDTQSLTEDPDGLCMKSIQPSSSSASISGHHGEKASSIPGRPTVVIPPLIDRLAAAKGGDRRTSNTLSTANSTSSSSGGGAGGGGLSRNKKEGLSSSQSSLTDSGEFSVRIPQLPPSLSAMKDGLSLKLKNQTRHFIKSFKEKKKPLMVKSPSSPLLHFSQNTRKPAPVKDLNVPLTYQPEESARQETHPSTAAAFTNETTTRRLSDVDRERMPLQDAAATLVKNELESLYKKAVHIQAAVKTSNLIMQPTVFKSILNTWCRELNAVMFKFLKELQQRKERENEKGKKNEAAKGNEEEEDKKKEGDKGGATEEAMDCIGKRSDNIELEDEIEVSICDDNPQSLDSRDMMINASSSQPSASTSTRNGNLSVDSTKDVNSHPHSHSSNPPSGGYKQETSSGSNCDHFPSHHRHHHHHHLHYPNSIDKNSFVWLVNQMLNVTDPLCLSANQQQAFHDLCTLCFLCGATGDFLSTFQLLEDQEDSSTSCSHHCHSVVIESILPKQLQPSFLTGRSDESEEDDFLSFLVQKTVFSDLLDNNIDSKTTCPCQLSFHHNMYVSKNGNAVGQKSLNNTNIQCHSFYSFKHFKQHKDSTNYSSESSVVKTASHNSLKRSNGSNNNDDENALMERVEEQEYNCGTHKDGEDEEVGRVLLTSDQKEDLELALFLRMFFFILDYPLVKQRINSWRCSKFLTWTALITCCKEKGKSDIVSSLLSDRHTNAAIDYLRSGILLHPSTLIGHLHRLFQYTPGKTAEFCCEVQGSITVQEVVAMCVLSDKSPGDALLRYVRKYVIDVPFFLRSIEFGKLCDVKVVRLLLLAALLQVSGKVEKKDNVRKEGQSLAMNVISVLPHDWLEQILSRVTSPEEQDFVLHLCMVLRQWKPCLRLMSTGQDKRPVIELLVALGDLDLISQNGYIPRTTEEWRMLLFCFLRTRAQSKKKNTDNHTEAHNDSDNEGDETNQTLPRTLTAATTPASDVVMENERSSPSHYSRRKKNQDDVVSTKSNNEELNEKEEEEEEERDVDATFHSNTSDEAELSNSVLRHNATNCFSKTSNKPQRTEVEKDDHDGERRCEGEESKNRLSKPVVTQNNDESTSLTTTKTVSANRPEIHHREFEQHDDASPLRLALPTPAGHPMTWESLSKLLVLHLGGAAAAQMMCDYLCAVPATAAAYSGDAESLTSSSFSSSSSSLDQWQQVPLTSCLLQACLSDFNIEADQNQVCHEMLERLSVHMWAKKPGFLPPSVGHAIQTDTKLKLGGSKALEEDFACHRQINLLQSTSSQVLMSENYGVHWGQDVYMKQACQCCQMPLRLIVSHDLPGVVLFPCGDAFHKKCCPGSSCPILH